MFNRKSASVWATAAVLMLGVVTVMAADQPQQQPRQGRGQGQGPGQGGPGRGGMGGGFGDPVNRLVAVVADLYLNDEITLTKDQKASLKSVRAEYAKARKDDERRKLFEEMAAAREKNDQDKLDELRTKMQDLNKDLPDPEDYVKKVRAVFTAEQLTKIDAAVKARDAQMPGRGGGRNGGGQGGGRPTA